MVFDKSSVSQVPCKTDVPGLGFRFVISGFWVLCFTYDEDLGSRVPILRLVTGLECTV